MTVAAFARPIRARPTLTRVIVAASLGLLRVELLFLPEQLRRGRLGSRILATAEEEARRRGCTRGVLSTLHFHVPGFLR